MSITRMSDNDSLKQTTYDALRTGFFERGEEAFNKVKFAAEAAVGRGHYFAAGYLWMKAADTLWGNPDRYLFSALRQGRARRVERLTRACGAGRRG